VVFPRMSRFAIDGTTSEYCLGFFLIRNGCTTSAPKSDAWPTHGVAPRRNYITAMQFFLWSPCNKICNFFFVLLNHDFYEQTILKKATNNELVQQQKTLKTETPEREKGLNRELNILFVFNSFIIRGNSWEVI